MNVLFINSLKDSPDPAKPVPSQVFIHLGISYISSVLRSHQHTTELLVLTNRTPKRFVNETINRVRPGLICFTAVATEYDFISQIARHIKGTYPGIYLLAGGPHVSLNPDAAIHDSFDAICIGEGEHPTLELAARLQSGQEPLGISNLWLKNNGAIEKNRTRPFNQDLDALPYPDRVMWQKWITDPATMHTIILGRGCPFRCAYCCNHALRGLAPGRYVRLRSPSSVVGELADLVRNSPDAQEVYFEVETIGLNVEFAVGLCAKLKRFLTGHRGRLSFGTNLRITPNSDYDDLLNALKSANFRFLNIGLESGSDKVRRNALKRTYSNADVIRAVRLAKKHGFRVNLYVMVGIPGETRRDFQETIECVRECQPDGISLSIFFPYPGTELHRVCKESGLLDRGINTAHERELAVLDLPGFSRQQIQREYDWFDYKVRKGTEPLYSLIKAVTRRRIVSTHTHLLPLWRCFSSVKNLLRTCSCAFTGGNVP